MLAALSRVLNDVGSENEGVFAVVGDHGVVHLEPIATPVEREWARWAALPSLVPLLREREARLAYVLGFVTPAGADVGLFEDRAPHLRLVVDGRSGTPTVDEASWTQARVTRRHDASWNALFVRVADELTWAVKHGGAAMAIVVTDNDSRAVLEELLDPQLRDLAVWVDATEPPPAVIERVDDELDRARTQVGLDRIKAARAAIAAGDAVEGARDVVDALASGCVEALLVADELDGVDPRGWFDRASGQVTLERPAAGGDVSVEGRLVDGCVCGALRAGLRIGTVPAGHFEHGLVALLA